MAGKVMRKFLFDLPMCFFLKCKVQNEELVCKRNLEKPRGRYELDNTLSTDHSQGLVMFSSALWELPCTNTLDSQIDNV